jgi:hypothetical protein
MAARDTLDRVPTPVKRPMKADVVVAEVLMLVLWLGPRGESPVVDGNDGDVKGPLDGTTVALVEGGLVTGMPSV